MLRIALIAALLALGLAPLAPPHDALARPRPAMPPALLSETGLYLPGTTSVRPEHLAFSPQYPLWSDGAAKARWVSLPRGATITIRSPAPAARSIDARALDAWDFPVGTRFWKEFMLGGRRVETRMIWRAGPSEWVFATYVWNDDQSDAALAPEAGVRSDALVAEGRFHEIPGSDACRACHEAGASTVLGFNALQLSDDRDPLAPHAEPLAPGMVTNRVLIERGVLVGERAAIAGLASDPPRIAASSPQERAALGYLAGNCGGCHDARGELAPLGLDLARDALGSAVDVPGRWQVPGIPPEGSRRIAPGAPDHSAILYRMRSRRPSSQMPPLGTQVPDAAAIELIERWIAGL